jgi:ethanolamine ammonia-lyase small subunit
MFNLNWTIGIGLLCLLIGAFGGYEFEANRYNKFKESVIVAQKVAESETKRIVSESQRNTKEISDAYQNDISIIRRFYTSRLQHGSSGIHLPTVSVTATRIDESAPNEGLIGQCAETTLMLVDLQHWIKDQQIIWNYQK